MSWLSVSALHLLEISLRNINYIGTLCWNLAFAYSVVWIIYRIYQVCQKPNSELVEILGIDIPPVPEVALAGITTDSVLLYWKPPDNYSSPLRHFVQVNGINVGEFNRSDASVQVTGLKPGTYYGLRAIATNSSNLSSQSRLIQVQTTLLTGHEGSRQIASSDQVGTQSYGKRTGLGRRHSAATNSTEHTNGQPQSYGVDSEEQGPEETMAQLTKKLDLFRHQQEEMDRQIAEDAEENERVKAALTRERDELKQKVEEKEKAHLEFKKQVNELEKQCKAAQRKKSAKERLLQQKKAEKQKKLDDVARWKEECVEMQRDTEVMKRERVAIEETHEHKMAATRKIIDEANAENRVLEEEIRVWGIKIKEMEAERRRTDSEQNEEEREAERRDKEEEEVHERKVRDYEARIAEVWTANQQAEIDYQQAEDRLNYWLSKRAKEPHAFAPKTGLDYHTSTAVHSSRRIRQGASRASTISQSSSGYPKSASAFNSISSMSPTFASASPYFSMSNGMTATSNVDQTISQHDIESLTGGALMSPTANNLLPANLLHDDEAASNSLNHTDEQGVEASVNAHILQLYMASTIDVNNQDPHSPMSIESRSPSLISSPHESIHNLHGYYPSRDPLAESDRRSIHSTGSPFAPGILAGANAVNGRRLTGLFNFNRQRGKSTINEPPPLGTLKQGQSQSFPRNFDQDPIDPIGSARRRLGSGNWTNPMSSFLTRSNVGSSSGTDGEPASSARLGFTRRSRLHMFGPKLDPSDQLASLGRSASPRPSSTYSFENTLPRPSSDSQPFGWASSDGPHQRSSPLVPDWSSIGGPWSRNQSRRASVQYGSTSNLSIGSTPLEPEDYSSPFGKKVSPPAPIGTGRNKAGQRNITPKLNPAAPSFTTRLFSRNDTKKSIKGDKSGEKSTDGTKVKEKDKTNDLDLDSMPEDSSPPTSRLSKDAHSISTATSVGESHDSLDHSTSATPSEGAATSAPKESLMQRITRKSSSKNFNVPWSKDRSGLFSKKTGEPSTPGELDEDGASDYLLGKPTDSATSTPQHEKGGRPSLSWSRVMRKSKKGEKEASESSERASETETGDDDDS